MNAQPPVPTIAPATGRTNPAEKHYGRVAYNVFNMRLTEKQYADLQKLRDATGIPIQSHIRRAILDYLYQLRREQPELFKR